MFESLFENLISEDMKQQIASFLESASQMRAVLAELKAEQAKLVATVNEIKLHLERQ